MKKVVFISVLILMALLSNAQINSGLGMGGHEKKAFTSKINFKPSAETENYNILYHRIFWQVDPAKHYIEGNVTSIVRLIEI